MNLRTLTQAGGMALILALAPPLMAKDSGDCDVAIDLGKKPEMSDHSQLNAFIAAALEYKSQKSKQDQHRKSCPELYLEQPVVWVDDPTVTQGPETLDSAVERSESFPSLDYGTTDEWYGRSTSKSFSLSDVDGNQLAQNLIQTSLSTLNPTSGNNQSADPSAEQQQAMLILAGMMPNTEDGAYTQGIYLDELTRNLFFIDQEVPFILAGSSVTAMPSPNGSITFSDIAGDTVKFYGGLAETETCLSSCGEFSLTISIE